MGWRSIHAVASVAAAVLVAGVATAAPAHAVTACTETDLRTDIAAGGIVDLTPYCVYTLTDPSGQITVSTPVTIHGNNATIRRDLNATTDFRVFEVGATSLTMDTLTVMNGDAGGNSGGGVFLNTDGGSLTTTDVNFQGNTAEQGGAIDAEESAVTLSLTGGTITDNRGRSQGGGIAATGDAAATMNSVTVSGNRALRGAGVYISATQPVSITDSAISNNTAKQSGGGVSASLSGAALSVTGTTITDNRVTNSTAGGGGFLFTGTGGGTATVTGSTISGNTVTGFNTPNDANNLGGGIHLRQGALTLDSTTVFGNQLIGAQGHGAGIAARANLVGQPVTLTVQNGTTVTGNLASGRYSQGGGLYAANGLDTTTVSLTGSDIDANKVTGTGSAAAGIYNNGATFSALTTSSVDNNTAPSAPAPGGIYTTVAITNTTGSTFTGNTPTNCVFSPAAVTGCVG